MGFLIARAPSGAVFPIWQRKLEGDVRMTFKGKLIASDGLGGIGRDFDFRGYY